MAVALSFLLVLLSLAAPESLASTGELLQDDPLPQSCNALVGKWVANRWVPDSGKWGTQYSTKVRWVLKVRSNSDGCSMDLVIESLSEEDRLEYVQPSSSTATRQSARPVDKVGAMSSRERYEAQIKNFDGKTTDLVEFRRVLRPLELPDQKMRLTPDGKLEFLLISPPEDFAFVARSLGKEATITLKRKK